jgi:hypothetical protein
MAAWSSYERALVMSQFLTDEWGIEASGVYDRPPSHVGRIDDMETLHSLFTCLQVYAAKPLVEGDRTILTGRSNAGYITRHSSNPARIIPELDSR